MRNEDIADQHLTLSIAIAILKPSQSNRWDQTSGKQHEVKVKNLFQHHSVMRDDKNGMVGILNCDTFDDTTTAMLVGWRGEQGILNA